MHDLMSDAAWIKANALVKEKYGKNLSYRAIKLLGSGSISESEAFYSVGDDLIIPLKLKDYNLGDVVVARGSLLDPQQKSEITDLVKFLVEPKIYSLQLKKSEENLLRAGRQTLSLVEDEDSVIALYSSEKATRRTLSQVILLKSHTELNRNKVALKIHEMTGRNLFVHLDDIADSLTSKEDISTLTDMTIYIDDVESLSTGMLNMLQDYLEAADGTSPGGKGGGEGPLFLVGSGLSLEAIQQKSWPPALKADLMGFFFDIDRVPLSQQTSEDILDLLFFELDSVLT